MRVIHDGSSKKCGTCVYQFEELYYKNGYACLDWVFNNLSFVLNLIKSPSLKQDYVKYYNIIEWCHIGWTNDTITCNTGNYLSQDVGWIWWSLSFYFK